MYSATSKYNMYNNRTSYSLRSILLAANMNVYRYVVTRFFKRYVLMFRYT
jgi:hypothetical protein